MELLIWLSGVGWSCFGVLSSAGWSYWEGIAVREGAAWGNQQHGMELLGRHSCEGWSSLVRKALRDGAALGALQYGIRLLEEA